MSSIYLRGKIYWYKARVNGKNHYQSLKTNRKRIATALQKKLDKKMSNPATNSKPDDLPYWIGAYIIWLSESVTPLHLKNCQSRLNRFLEHCNDNSAELESVTVETVQSFLDGLMLNPDMERPLSNVIFALLHFSFFDA